MEDAAAHELSLERMRLAIEALQACHKAGVPEEYIRTLAFEAGITEREWKFPVGNAAE